MRHKRRYTFRRRLGNKIHHPTRLHRIFTSSQYGGRKKTVKGQHCSPAQEGSFTCYTLDSLLKIAKAWNKKHPQDKIALVNSQPLLWERIDRKMKGTCRTEKCWMEQNFVKEMKNTSIKKNFRHKIPRDWKGDQFQWLSTTDIEQVLKQYEDKYPHFSLIGPVPLDFDSPFSKDKDDGCVSDELCHIDLSRLHKKNIHHLGVVFNMDPHDEPGSHWVALFADFIRGEITYYDSYGLNPPSEITQLIQRLQDQSQKMGKKLSYHCNRNRHQFKHSECGVYCIYFISQCLQGMRGKDVCNSRLSDDFIHQKRSVFYRERKPE